MSDGSHQQQAPEASHRRQLSDALKVDPHDVLWVTDAELIRRSGIPEKAMRIAIQMLDRERRSGFPRKVALFGNRRYWPAVVKYFELVGGMDKIGSTLTEHLHLQLHRGASR